MGNPEDHTYRYRDAGVDIDAGNALVDAIRPLAATTNRPGAMASIGGFGGLFDLRAAGYRDPLLVAATDGVGTKLMIAEAVGDHTTIGIDLVAMCVNDLVVQGAEPLLFLDYFATGRLSADTAATVIAGIADGCRMAGCALLGGETAEMPGMYPAGRYDLAGFAVGAVERDRLLTGADIAPGDILLGLASDGLHANGFSLIRRIVADRSLDYAEPALFAPEQTLGGALLTPTRIYCRPLLDAMPRGIKGLAHITGGGLIENLPRILPTEVGAEIAPDSWPLPPVYQWLAGDVGVPPMEMARTFNCGIGMIVVTGPDTADAVTAGLRDAGEMVFPVGSVTPRAPDRPVVELPDLDHYWTR